MSEPFTKQRVNSFIVLGNILHIDKMQDIFLEVTFRYHTNIWNGAIPLFAKYQGVKVTLTKTDVYDWAGHCYAELDPGRCEVWQKEQNQFWEGKNAYSTQTVFNALNGKDVATKWLCRICGPVPKVNPQSAARIKKLKQYGYCVATKRQHCTNCGKDTHHDLLVRLSRQAANNEKRMAMPKSLEKRIKQLFFHKDACFDNILSDRELVIDHKFPSSRWVQGEEVNDIKMTDREIMQKFQLLTNQINLQKERYCQRCVLKGVRGDFFGIVWYYDGDNIWRGNSKADEKGCVGCCWYDIVLWKNKLTEHLNKLLNTNDK